MICSLSTSWKRRLWLARKAGLSRRIWLTRPINCRRLSGRSMSQCLDLVLLRVQVLFPARSQRTVFAQLEGRPVDAIAGTQGGRQDEARDEGRAPAELQVLRQDIRRVGPEVRAEELAHLGLRQLGQVLGQLPLGVAPGEVVVRLREAELGQAVQHLGPGEGFGQEDALRGSPA